MSDIEETMGREIMEVAMTPLEKIQSMKMPFAELQGVRFTEAGRDRVVARMLVRPDLCTLGDTIHGGAIMALADSVGAAATVINLPEHAKGTTTIESKTNFIGGARQGMTVVATATPVHRGRRTQVWQTRLETEEGKLIAAGDANPDGAVRGSLAGVNQGSRSPREALNFMVRRTISMV
jgi:uncharacterized protein (TIGR00369 family)